MQRAWVIPISLLVVLVLLIGMGALACGGNGDESGAPPSGDGEEVTLGPPTPGEWAASTEFGELGFTVNSDSTGITKVSFNFVEFECGGSSMSGGVSTENPSLWSINDGLFTIETSGMFGEVVIEGEFDDTGTHAAGTWEINACSGTWEALPGS